MRLRRPKIHIIDTAEPLLGYHALVTRCGEIVVNAAPVVMFSGECFQIWPTRTCIDCLRSEPSGEHKRTYMYGLVEKATEEMAELEESA